MHAALDEAIRLARRMVASDLEKSDTSAISVARLNDGKPCVSQELESYSENVRRRSKSKSGHITALR